MTKKLIRTALVLLILIGTVLVLNAAEADAGLMETLGALGVMFSGMVGLGLSFCVSMRGAEK